MNLTMNEDLAVEMEPVEREEVGGRIEADWNLLRWAVAVSEGGE